MVLFVLPRYTFPVTDLTVVSSLGIYLLTGPGITYLASSYKVVAINAATAREMTAKVERLERELSARQPPDPGQATLEERFRTPADEMRDSAIYLLDDRGRHATWNKGVRRLLGYEKAEFLQRGAADLYPPEDRAAGIPDRELAAAVQHGRSAQERWLVRKDGSRFWAALSVASVRGRHGQLVGFACTLRDHTGLRQVEEELRRHREALELAHDAAGLGAWQYEVGTGELRLDARAKALFGFAPDAGITYAAFVGVLHPDDRTPVEERWARALRERMPFSAEYRVLWSDGAVHWLASMGRATSLDGQTRRSASPAWCSTSPSASRPRRGSRRCCGWRRSGSSPAASRTISTTCSPPSWGSAISWRRASSPTTIGAGTSSRSCRRRTAPRR